MARKTESPVFIGIDLAWKASNPSGGAVIREGRLIASTGTLGSNDEIVAFVAEHLPQKGGAVVAVDAPLRVPNQTGSRPCDAALSADWRRYHAGALPANRTRLAEDGVVRGEALVAGLVQELRFAEATTIPRRSQARLVCEVFPHPAHVSLFGLERILKYKRGAVDERRMELARYQQLLRGLRKASPPLKGTKKLLTGVDMTKLRGRGLKEYEDMLDAITCAYVAAYLWEQGPKAAITYGTLAEGSILVPILSKKGGM
jgi:predicted RNase H-like nuclease